MRAHWYTQAFGLLIGAAYSSAQPLGIAIALGMPILALRAPTRSAAFRLAACYYFGALWPLVPAARNFFGPSASPLGSVALWAAATLVLAIPWLMVHSGNRRGWWWSGACGLLLTAIPPLGLIGWASPLTAAGFLFPGTCWLGLTACAIAPGLIAAVPRRAVPLFFAAAIVCNVLSRPAPSPPRSWIGLNTNLGGVAHEALSPSDEFSAVRAIQRAAIATHGQVILLPETVVPTWTDSADVFWAPVFKRLRGDGKVILIGTRLPVQGSTGAIADNLDLHAAIALLSRGTVAPFPAERASQFRYDNGIVIRGGETGVFRQRVPVPIGMWRPFRRSGARVHPFDPGVTRIQGRRVAVLICYEQLLVWPAAISLLHSPEVICAIANDYWVSGTPIKSHQQTALKSWSRLFRLPLLTATNS